LMMIVPRIVRDWVYDLVAHYRYQWFGQYDQCRFPGDKRDRFLD
jgi:predicted DCC family thiol-disulfide oxidoreductase YuxK